MRKILCTLGSITLAACLISQAAGYEKIRFYEFGENDQGAVLGGVALETTDSVASPTYEDEFIDGPDFAPPNLPFGFEFVDLFAPNEGAAPIYAAGRTGGFSLQFDGDDFMEGDPFDPRPNSKGVWNEEDPNLFSFTTISQAWVNPSSDGLGDPQVLWTVGAENGGVGITDDGFWEIMHPNRKLNGEGGASEVAVTFDDWSHVTMRRWGNGSVFYVNGEVVGESDGFWGGVGTLTVGSNLGGESGYVGLLDDFNISTYRGPGFGFDEAEDIDFFNELVLSGILGDVDQDADVDNDDYQIWSANSGFDNELGFGDPSTLLLGDVDQNGRINFFDFNIISGEAAAAGNPLTLVPEPSSLVLLGIGFMACLGRVRSKGTPTVQT